jgi:transcriptional regulator with XRE-family HTH domain
MDPGERLKQIRTKLGITTREVALFSRSIADAMVNPDRERKNLITQHL